MTKEELLQKADQIAEDIAQLKKQEQELRKKAADSQTPDEVWEHIINGLTIKTDRKKYPNSIFFFKEDEVYFELENEVLWCRYSKVWLKISEVISGDYDTTQAFIKTQVEEHFKMKGVTPQRLPWRNHYKVEEHFKMKGVTPKPLAGGQGIMVEEHFKMKGVTPYDESKHLGV